MIVQGRPNRQHHEAALWSLDGRDKEGKEDDKAGKSSPKFQKKNENTIYWLSPDTRYALAITHSV